MKKLILVLVACSLAWASCKHSETTKCGPCPLIATIAPYLKIRIVDKTTGADLFLSPDSPYKLSDLKVTGSVSGTDIALQVDSLDKSARYVRLLAIPAQTFTLKLANLTPDNITVEARNDSPKCCPVLKITRIKLDDALICAPCTSSEFVTIEK